MEIGPQPSSRNQTKRLQQSVLSVLRSDRAEGCHQKTGVLFRIESLRRSHIVPVHRVGSLHFRVPRLTPIPTSPKLGTDPCQSSCCRLVRAANGSKPGPMWRAEVGGVHCGSAPAADCSGGRRRGLRCGAHPRCVSGVCVGRRAAFSLEFGGCWRAGASAGQNA